MADQPKTDSAGAAKSGVMTSEFWLVVALFALIVANKLLDLGLDQRDLLAAGLGVAGYPIGRGLAKSK